MSINAYYNDQELRTQRTNLEAMGYYFGGQDKGCALVIEISDELARRATLPPHPSNLAFGLEDNYGNYPPYDQDQDD